MTNGLEKMPKHLPIPESSSNNMTNNTDRRDKMAVVIIIVMMVFQTSLHKLLAGIIPAFNLSYNPPWLCIMYVMAMGAVFVLVLFPRRANTVKWLSEHKYLVAELAVLLLAIISVDIVTLVRGQLRLSNIITHNLDYFYAFLVIPVLILIEEKRWLFKQMLDTMMAITLASGIMRMLASLYWNKTGIEILCITRESAFEGWIRNDRLRVTAPCFLMLCIPIAAFFFFKTKSLAYKIFYAIVEVFALFYCFYIWQSRAAVLYGAVCIASMILFIPADAKKMRLRIELCILAAELVLALGGLKIVMGMFSAEESSKYFMENKGHFNVYECFLGKYLEHPILGDGLTETLAEWFPNGRALWLCDGGLLYSIVPMGILMIVFFIMMFSRGIFVYFKYLRVSEYALLALACTVMVLVSGISLDIFFTPTAFSAPFYLAIVEIATHETN